MGWGDRFRAAFGMSSPNSEPIRREMFTVEPVLPVDQLLLHMWAKTGTVDRARALRVPAVLAGRRLICSIATLPLEAVDAGNRVQDHPLLRQFDANMANVVLLSQLVEDLLFDAVGWLRITAFGWDGYPVNAVRYDPSTVSLQAPKGYENGYLPSGLPTNGVVWMGGEAVPHSEVIRFDSPAPALLDAGQDAIRRAIALDAAMDLYARNPRRRGYFTPKDGADPADDDAVQEILDAWHEGSRRHADGYVPAALDYNSIQDSTPTELQLLQQQQRATLDLANALGVDPEDLGVNTTSRTYQNATDRRQDRINETLAPFMRAVTDRLSMPDVTKRGVTVRFNLRDYLKADPKTRAEVQQIYSAMGATDAAEVREQEGLQPRAIQTPAADASLPSPDPRRAQPSLEAA